MTTKKNAPSWTDVKGKLADFDRAGLLGLVQSLYAANKDNQSFLHARLGLGEDPLKPYKAIVSRWVCPDVLRNQDVSIATAKKAISDYKKAIGHPEGLAELAVFYCEEVSRFLDYCGMDNEGYYAALVRMFEQALKATLILPETQRDDLLDRLEEVRAAGQSYGWGVDEDFNWLWQKAGLEIDA
ncbi:hypothetical protein [Accumulibacter sp.]|uniref:hypothetical protein n=1 Tax=Accumulibacter sp. TaxID=2053492 RepID=UPI0028C446B7|nr:hypothetical protein [Accumulibacter sp.]